MKSKTKQYREDYGGRTTEQVDPKTGQRTASEKRVARDISERDHADLKKGRKRAYGKTPPISKLDKLRYEDAKARKDRDGWMEDGYTPETGKGEDPKRAEKARKKMVKEYKTRKYAKGGRVGDGCAQRGRTKGRMV